MDIEGKKKELNRLNFKGLEDIRMGDALYYTILMEERHCKGKVSLIKVLLCVIRELFLGNMSKIEKETNSKILFLFSSEYADREDYWEWYRKVRNMCVPSILVRSCGKKIAILSVRRLLLAKSWYMQLRQVFSARLALYFLRHLVSAYDEFETVKQVLQEENIESIFTLCDAHLSDSMITQWSNNSNVTTVTLQHGIFVAGSDFSLSHSKYFLSHGQFSLEQAEKSGKKEGVLRVGMPQIIGEVLPIKIVKNKLMIIGVLFAGSSIELMRSDIKILEWVLNYATTYGYQVVVKFHPGYEKEEYKIDWTRVSATYSREISVEEFAAKIDFAVVNSSTVFLEMLMKMVPSVVYDESDRLYENAGELRIRGIDDFHNKLEEYIGEREVFQNNMLKVREYYSETEDVEGKYRRFILELMKSLE